MQSGRTGQLRSYDTKYISAKALVLSLTRMQGPQNQGED